MSVAWKAELQGESIWISSIPKAWLLLMTGQGRPMISLTVSAEQKDIGKPAVGGVELENGNLSRFPTTLIYRMDPFRVKIHIAAA